MATFVGTSNRVYVGQLDLSGSANDVRFGDLTRAMQDATTFNDGGYTCRKPGLISGEAAVKGFQDFASGGVDETINGLSIGTQYPLTVVPNPTGTVTAGDACWMSRGVLGKANPLSGAKGEMGGFEFGFNYDTAVVQSKVAHPLAARTSTGNGTAVTLTGPTSTQSLYAALHVTAYSGFTNVVFKVQSDDSGAFSSATDRITFTTVTGVGSQFSSVAGSFSGETHHRATWTVTGSGSVSFVVVFGVI